jgi:hypothetical protein
MTVIQPALQGNTPEDFDLDGAAITKIVKHAHSERERLSEHAPSNAGGSTFYYWIVSGIREHLLALGRGWAKRNVNGLEVIEHKDQRLRIAYVSAEGTSDEVMKSSPRGPMSVAAAEKNGQLRLLSANYYEQTRTRAVHPAAFSYGFKTWFIAIERDGGIYRVVLALPTETEGGRFVSWEHRIHIADVALDSEPKNDAVESSPAAEATTPPKPKRRQKAAPANDVTIIGANAKKN